MRGLRDVAANIGREARHRLREGVVLHGADPSPAQRGVEIARLLFVVDKIPKHERDRMRPTRVSKPNSYPLGSYRIATAPEPNSSRLTSLKSTRFDSPANNVGPWPASLGCTTNSYSSINPSSANASGSFTPPTSS